MARLEDNTEDTMTYQEFIDSTGLRMTCESWHENPASPDWKDADHWRCVLSSSKFKGRFTVYFSQGYGHNGKEPSLAGLLECLAGDTRSLEYNPTFEDWCSEFGFDTDSRKAERTFKATEKQAARLRRFLGDSAMNSLLRCGEDQ